MNARQLALAAMIKWRREGAWPDLYLKKEGAEADPREAALASAITYGTIQNLYCIDHCIQSYSSMPLKKITPQVLDAMRITTWQLLYSNEIPARAAVDEGVKLVKKHGNPMAGRFANAVLRKIAQHGAPDIDTGDPVSDLSIKYSHPEWLTRYLVKRLRTQQCELLLECNNARPGASARVNTLKTTRSQLLELLHQQGVQAQPHAFLSDAIVFEKLGGALKSKAFEQGMFYIQDSASQLAVLALSPKSGEFVIDMCAAPGGKSLLAAQLMRNSGRVLSIDIHPHKTELIEQAAIKCGADIIETVATDASVSVRSLLQTADAIICDVPCSGMGVIRKKPDIRYKEQSAFSDLPRLQAEILKTAAGYLKVGASLVYSTCTILQEENEQVVADFLKENSEYSLEPFYLPEIGEVEGIITLWPHVHQTDGFFIAKIKRCQ